MNGIGRYQEDCCECCESYTGEETLDHPAEWCTIHNRPVEGVAVCDCFAREE